MIDSTLIMQVPFYETKEEKEKFLLVLGAVAARLISLAKGAETLNMGRDSLLELLTAMNVPFSYLDDSDISVERNW